MKIPLLLAYWVDHLDPFLVRFTDTIGIRYYGLAYMFGFLVAAWLLYRYAKAGRTTLPAAKIGDLMIALVFGVLIGGRVGYFLLYGFGTLLHHPLALFEVWDGGMASHGGFVGVLIALVWFCRKNQLPFLHLGDVIVSVTPIGLFFGRIANFINGELWGKISHVPWAVIFPLSAPPGTPLGEIPPRHPSQLYEAGLEGLLLFVYMQWRFWKTGAVRAHPGRLGGEFLLGYAIVRAIGEQFREPDAGISLILGLHRGTFYSIFVAIAGVALILYSRRAQPAPPSTSPKG